MYRSQVQHRVHFFNFSLHLVERRIKIEVRSLHQITKKKKSSIRFVSFLGMAFSPMTFTTSPAHSIYPGSRTPMSTPSRARSDLGSVRKLRLVNEQEESVRLISVENFNFLLFLRNVKSILIRLIIKLLSGVLMFMLTIVNVVLLPFSKNFI